MFGLIDRFTATEDEKRLARRWADYAITHYGDNAPRKLREGLAGRKRVKSKRALRLAIRRAEARVKTTIAISTR